MNRHELHEAVRDVLSEAAMDTKVQSLVSKLMKELDRVAFGGGIPDDLADAYESFHFQLETGAKSLAAAVKLYGLNDAKDHARKLKFFKGLKMSGRNLKVHTNYAPRGSSGKAYAALSGSPEDIEAALASDGGWWGDGKTIKDFASDRFGRDIIIY